MKSFLFAVGLGLTWILVVVWVSAYVWDRLGNPIFAWWSLPYFVTCVLVAVGGWTAIVEWRIGRKK